MNLLQSNEEKNTHSIPIDWPTVEGDNDIKFNIDRYVCWADDRSSDKYRIRREKTKKIIANTHEKNTREIVDLDDELLPLWKKNCLLEHNAQTELCMRRSKSHRAHATHAASLWCWSMQFASPALHIARSIPYPTRAFAWYQITLHFFPIPIERRHYCL